MQPRTRSSNGTPSLAAGDGLRARVEALGSQLAERLSRVLDGLPRRPAGPQIVADVLGVTVVTASRLLKALSQPDPVSVLQLLPGPNPLRKVLESAREQGAPEDHCAAALEAVAAFDDLIRNVAGDRGSLRAMLSAWLPEERREFEAQRRQQIFKASAELEGVSAELDVNCLLVAPGDGPGRFDIVDVKCLLGIDRIRPDAVVRFATLRLPGRELADRPDPTAPRMPLTLDGEPATDGLHSVRLDDYCHAAPAPLATQLHGDHADYYLGPTGFGPASRVDLVMAELNRGEILRPSPERERPPFYFTITEVPSKRLLFDLLLHEDVYPGCGPTLLSYLTSGRGPARAMDPSRELDRRPTTSSLEMLGSGLRRLRTLDYPRYVELVTHVFERLGWDPARFRGYRLSQPYPHPGVQLMMAFLPQGEESA